MSCRSSRSNCHIAPIAWLAAIIVIGSAHPAASQIVQGPKQYYLALGDSITYGYQAYKHEADLPPSAFNTGYVDVFAEHLRAIEPGIIVVNYGCPGESTRSFLKGPCLWTEFGQQLHDLFTGRQLDAALAFLRAHPGEVSPITLTLWGNNVREFSAACQGDGACIQNGAVKFIDDLTKDLAKILRALRKEAPDADIILTGTWDSFVDVLEFADPLFQLMNASMAAAAAAERVRFADPFPLFNPQGDVQREVQTLCSVLLLCGPKPDSHPSDVGYRVLGDLVWNVSAYGLALPQNVPNQIRDPPIDSQRQPTPTPTGLTSTISGPLRDCGQPYQTALRRRSPKLQIMLVASPRNHSRFLPTVVPTTACEPIARSNFIEPATICI